MLTKKQEEFAQAIAKGLGQADAYRSSYNTEKMKDNSVYRLAHELMKNIKVTSRIAELKKDLDNKQLWSREMSVKALITAFKEGNPSVKVAAVKELNIMHGYNEPTKIDVGFRQLPASIHEFC